MKTLFTTTALAIVFAAAAPQVHAADLAPQTVAVATVDVSGVSNGYRASKLIGTAVRNDQKQAIGKVDDLLVSRSDKVLFAVLSVGGFLGMGDKLVIVPYSSIQVEQEGDHQILVVPGATKDALKALPEFKYSK
jgi:ribosomal 30S subunit maturation factor RimM